MSQVETLKRSARERLEEERVHLNTKETQLQQTIEQTRALRQHLMNLPADTASQIDATMQTLREELSSLPENTATRLEPVIESVDRLIRDLKTTLETTRSEIDRLHKITTSTETTATNLQQTLEQERKTSEQARDLLGQDMAAIARLHMNRVIWMTIISVMVIPVLTVIAWPLLAEVRQWIVSLL